MKEVTLKYIFRKMLKQGHVHQRNLVSIHRILRQVLENEFTEDDYITLGGFSDECYEKGWRRDLSRSSRSN